MEILAQHFVWPHMWPFRTSSATTHYSACRTIHMCITWLLALILCTLTYFFIHNILHVHCAYMYINFSSKSECDDLRSANSKLKDELEQLKEKYHSQLGDGVRIKREVRSFWKRSYSSHGRDGQHRISEPHINRSYEKSLYLHMNVLICHLHVQHMCTNWYGKAKIVSVDCVLTLNIP